MNNIVAINESQYEQIISYSSIQFTQKDFPELSSTLKSENIMMQHYGTIGIARLLSKDNQTARKYIDKNLVQTVLYHSMLQQFHILQHYSTQILLELASGNPQNRELLVSAGGISVLLELIKTSKANVKPFLKAINKIICDKREYRDIMINVGGIQTLESLSERYRWSNQQVAFMCYESLSSLFIISPLPQYEKVKTVIKLFVIILKNQQIKAEIYLDNYYRPIAYYLKQDKQKVSIILEVGILPQIFFILQDLQIKNMPLICDCLEIITNITKMRNDDWRNDLINRGIIKILERILRRFKAKFLAQIIQILSEINLTEIKHIYLVIKQLITLFQVGTNRQKIQISKFLITNRKIGHRKQIYLVIEQSYVIIDYLLLINCIQRNYLQLVLECFYELLILGQLHKFNGKNILVEQIKNKSIINIFQRFLFSEDDRIFDTVSNIKQILTNKVELNPQLHHQ